MAAIISQEYNLETRLRKIKRLKGYFTYTVQLKHEHIGTQQQIQMMIYAVVMQPFFFFFFASSLYVSSYIFPSVTVSPLYESAEYVMNLQEQMPCEHFLHISKQLSILLSLAFPCFASLCLLNSEKHWNV